MSELRELYQQVILDHNKAPRNFGKLDHATCDQEGHNPLCGDSLHVYLHIEAEVIQDISFEGSGCAISRASASMMTAALKGKTVSEAQQYFDRFHDMLMSEIDAPIDQYELGKLAVFAGIREFPMRVKCATLAWHTFKSALTDSDTPVTTD
jgi:nitrogen fixation protein NifU and related proteins